MIEQNTDLQISKFYFFLKFVKKFTLQTFFLLGKD